MIMFANKNMWKIAQEQLYNYAVNTFTLKAPYGASRCFRWQYTREEKMRTLVEFVEIMVYPPSKDKERENLKNKD